MTRLYRRRGGCPIPYNGAIYETQTGDFGGSAGGGGTGTAAAAAGAARAPDIARHARRGGRRHGVRHGSRHAHVLPRRQRGGCRSCHHAGGQRGGVFAFRIRRRSAHPGAHEGRQGARHRGRGHDAQTCHGAVLPRPQAHRRRNDRAARSRRHEGLGAGGGDSARAGAGHGGSRAGDAARVRHEIVRRDRAARYRTGRRLSDRRVARHARSTTA